MTDNTKGSGSAHNASVRVEETPPRPDDVQAQQKDK